MHRWGFAHAGRAVDPAFGSPAAALDPSGLGLAGDGLGGSACGVESAWASARELARLVGPAHAMS